MKSGIFLGLLLFCGCTLVEPGHVGIKVNLYGSDKGVDSVPLVTGRVYYNPWSEQIYTFPTYMQNIVWCESANEGQKYDESITFNSFEGAGVNADVAFSYTLQQDKVPAIFVKHRQTIELITNTYLHQKVRDALNISASKIKVTDIFGPGKEQLLKEAKRILKEEIEPQGFMIDNLGFISKFRVDDKVQQSINATITATQEAISAENKVKQSVAEAEQAVAKANGAAQSALINAKANAEANIMLAKSLSQELVQYQAVQKWDGVMPKVTGGALPFIGLEDNVKK